MSPILKPSSSKPRKDSSDCPVCVPIPTVPIFQCFEGHLICEGCLTNQRQCLVCGEDYPERRIRARGFSSDACSSCHKKFTLVLNSLDNVIQSVVQAKQILSPRRPLRFHGLHGTLVKISNDRVCAHVTGSDKALGYLAYTFFDRPIQANEKISINVTMGSKKSVFIMAGFTNEDPSNSKHLLNLFNDSCSFQIRQTTENKSKVNFYVDLNGRIHAETDGKKIYADQTFNKNKTIDLTSPVWAFVRLFHKNDQIEIIG